MLIIDPKKIENIIRDVAHNIVLPHWQHLGHGDISQKTGPDDLVTIADQAAEKELIAQISSLYPQSRFVGEEVCEIEPERMQLFTTENPIWVIDPIDGTMAFSKGEAQFDIMVALLQNRQLLAGFIYSPVKDDLYMGEKGGGVTRVFEKESTQLKRHEDIISLKETQAIIGKKFFSDEERNRILSHEAEFKKMLSTISAGHDYARLLRGEADATIYSKNMPWDHMPGLALASELGFVFEKQNGDAYMPDHNATSVWNGGLIVAPNKELLSQIQNLLFR